MLNFIICSIQPGFLKFRTFFYYYQIHVQWCKHPVQLNMYVCASQKHARRVDRKICEFLAPVELREKFPELEIGADPTDQTQLLDVCRRIIKYSVKTSTVYLPCVCNTLQLISIRLRLGREPFFKAFAIASFYPFWHLVYKYTVTNHIYNLRFLLSFQNKFSLI